MRVLYCLVIMLLFCHVGFAQEQTAADSATALPGIEITAFGQSRAISCGTIVKVVHDNNLDRNNKTSFVNAFNTVAGVRMEERSPGSYRINIRSSAIRSPFGVRNVKVYWNDIPVTDAGGNTYFNQFAYPNISYIEIVKGPAGSMYGAGTGGVLLMHSFETAWKPALAMEYITGSYGLQNILASAGFGKKENRSLLTYTHNQANGYRKHSSSNKDNLGFSGQYKVGSKQLLSVHVLYNHIFYETPGGLNLSEYNANPTMARPAAGIFSSAETAKAAIDQSSFLAGISHQVQFTTAFKNTSSLYGNLAVVKNPTFRNYERRVEPGYGGRTTFTYERALESSKLKCVWGGEWQRGIFNTQVSKNKNGHPDTLQTNDDITFTSGQVFAQADLTLSHQWILTAGVSLSRSAVNFTRLNSYPVQQQRRVYSNEWSPRLAIQKRFTNNNEVFASISKGFSPPTIAELLPSTGVISTFLQAESGVNYELGGRFFFFHKRLSIDATAFCFTINKALVLRKDSSNADYFVNAGNIQQQGIEINAMYGNSFLADFFDDFIIAAAYTFSYFKFGDYQKGTTNFSGRSLPGVPKHTLSIRWDILTNRGYYFNGNGYYASHVFLNDENTVAAPSYFLAGCRAGKKMKLNKRLSMNLYAGIDNLLNKDYSLGFDINAAAGRYYNAAPKRNYYVGIAFQR
ncbi:MAG: TonB-dependent receptor [Chitinophagaceae bacterium]|nr:TonB-dependent receptor [Chitinophagaceae bacterium]